MAVVYCALPLSGILLLLYSGAGLAASLGGNADAASGGGFRANVPPVDP
jgi:hypothetical protein